MSEKPFRYVHCPVLVLHLEESQITGDTVADALRDELLALYLQSGAIHVVLDMEKVTYLSSAGIRPLLSLKRQVSQHEGRLILCNLSKDVAGVLTATRLISTSRSVPATFESHPDVPAAIAFLYPESESEA